jgi:Ca2+-binding RTX toxin-like protein
VYWVRDVGDVVVELLGEGNDTVNTSVSYALTDNVETLALRGAATINATGNGLNNLITGNSAANVLSGLDGNDTLIANENNDTLLGGAGNDTLDGGTGNDSMVGGAGDDVYVVNAAGDVVVEQAGGGNDTVQSSITYSLGANVENLEVLGAANLNGTGNGLNNLITGNSGANQLSGLGGADTLQGGAGNDTLDGGTGIDSMEGGLGDDVYWVRDVGDVVVELLGEGNDTVNTSVSYALTDNVETLALRGPADIDATGNELNNLITGNSGMNVLSGLDGNDTLIANQGNDSLIGGAGNDTMTGGTGNDIFVFGSGFGQDRITDFDANPAGGQDRLDISALGITAGNFGANVSVSAIVGGGTLIGIGADSITLVGVNSATVTQQDFILA